MVRGPVVGDCCPTLSLYLKSRKYFWAIFGEGPYIPSDMIISILKFLHIFFFFKFQGYTLICFIYKSPLYSLCNLCRLSWFMVYLTTDLLNRYSSSSMCHFKFRITALHNLLFLGALSDVYLFDFTSNYPVVPPSFNRNLSGWWLLLSVSLPFSMSCKWHSFLIMCFENF